MKKFLIIFIVIAGVAIIGGYALLHKAKPLAQETSIVKRVNVIQQVSVTGTVKPVKSVDLAFQVSGKISKVYAIVGDTVSAGDMLIALDSQDLQAQLAKAKANLDQLNLDNVQNKANADIESAYTAGLTAAQKSASDGKIALLTLADIQYAHFSQNDQEGLRIAVAKANAIQALLGASDAGWWISETISILKGGAFETTQTAIVNQTHENIDAALSQTLAALQLVKNALDSVPVAAAFTDTEKANLSNAQNSITSEIITLTNSIQAIAVQKVANDNTIASTMAQIEAAKAAIQSIQAQIAQTQLVSPITGIVTKQDAKRGEIATMGAILVSVISQEFSAQGGPAAGWNIEAQVPEADIAKVKIDDTATFTLDAYGNSIIFQAKVMNIDPAEIVIDGVSTYKVTLTALAEDSRLRSGLTANIDILTDERTNVLAVPSRAIHTNSDQSFVLLQTSAATPEQRTVTTGLRGSDGNTEILSGLAGGENVIAQ